ncbi:MAG: 50S ribosomal protein L29 [Nanobdellota archaeon]
MKYSEMSKKNAEELEKMKKDSHIELMKEKAQVASGTMLKSPGKLSELRRTIAKINHINKKQK